ncbi:hypothetical protein [Streptomyces sp. MNP-20]|uniref:hypothetical protein n=1 Tax=Streptomyces sp. MNP-20 TaxID=2721165 RepID=UPI001556C38D|nr:hypothetical protein [Streptomyces sp. MNP-20]
MAGLASAAVLAMGIPAEAKQGTWNVPVSGCKVKQQVQLQGSPAHDHMRWYTTGGSKGCEAWIKDWKDGSTKGTYLLTNNDSHYSKWYYNGPGHKMQVCVNNSSGQMDCGPTN